MIIPVSKEEKEQITEENQNRWRENTLVFPSSNEIPVKAINRVLPISKEEEEIITNKEACEILQETIKMQNSNIRYLQARINLKEGLISEYRKQRQSFKAKLNQIYDATIVGDLEKIKKILEQK